MIIDVFLRLCQHDKRLAVLEGSEKNPDTRNASSILPMSNCKNVVSQKYSLHCIRLHILLVANLIKHIIPELHQRQK